MISFLKGLWDESKSVLLEPITIVISVYLKDIWRQLCQLVAKEPQITATIVLVLLLLTGRLVYKYFILRRTLREKDGTIEQISVLNQELAATKSESEVIKRENESLRAELTTARTELDRRARYRRILVGGYPVYALRAEFIGPGESPQFLCPLCFERGINSELICFAKNDTVEINKCRRLKHLKCLTDGCNFHVRTTLAAFNEAFKPA